MSINFPVTKLSAPPTTPTSPIGVPLRKNPAPGAKATETASGCCVDAHHLSPAARDKMATLLATEYDGSSWSNNPDHKAQLLAALIGIGSPLAAIPIIKDYNAQSWGYNASRKSQLLKALVATGDDAAAEAIQADYKNFSWSYHPVLKKELFDAMKQIAAIGMCPTAPTPTP